MAAQALSGIAKDLTKMSSKSAVKLVVPDGRVRRAVPVGRDPDRLEERAQGRRLLPRRPAADASSASSRRCCCSLALVLHGAGRDRSSLMRGELGRADREGEVRGRCSPTTAPSTCSRRRASSCSPRATSGSSSACPSSCARELGWSFWQVGAFLAVWVIGYGGVQAFAPRLLRRGGSDEPDGRDGDLARLRCSRRSRRRSRSALAASVDPTVVVVVGLIAFGVVFALNSAVHSYLILAYADGDRVAMNVGFYYMANAGGRLAGTVLSGLLYQWQGLEACLWASAVLVLGAAVLSRTLPAAVRRPRVATA